jgi:hypothetical protein
MTKVDNILMFFCMGAFFAGLVIAVATLPVSRRPRLLSTPPPSPRPSSGAQVHADRGRGHLPSEASSMMGS